MSNEIRRMAGHPEYDHATYVASGHLYTADGWTEERRLFRFRGPSMEHTTTDGMLTLARNLANHGSLTPGYTEDVTSVRCAADPMLMSPQYRDAIDEARAAGELAQ